MPIPYSKFDPHQKFDVIVIGSGMGGLSCAAALAKFGRKVLVLEQHYVAGGFTHTFSRKGYTWDVGVHCVGEMSKRDVPGRIIDWLSEGGVRFTSMGDVYEKFAFPKDSQGEFEIEFPATREGFRRALYEKFPDEADRASIDAYFKTIREVVNTAKPFFAMRTLPHWAGELGNQLLSRSLRFGGKTNYWAKTTAEVLAELVPNPRLRSVLTAQWGYYGATPSHSSFAVHAMTVRHFWNGGFYPAGGAATIGDSLSAVIERAGGAVVTRAAVDEILVEHTFGPWGPRAVGVRMRDGRELRAPRVISAAGAKATVESLLPKNHRKSDWASGIDSLRQSPPHLCYYLGLEGDVEAAGATRANQWFMETWDMEQSGWDVRDPNSIAPVLYVSFPSLKDPLHDPGPTGRHTAEVVTFVPWEAFEEWQDTRRGFRTPEYAAFKKSIETRLKAQLEKHVPRLMKLVKHAELSTPLSTIHFTRAPQGAIYGLEATPRRFLMPKLKTRTPIRGLYLAGGDVATLGVTGALMGGMLAASTLEPRIFARFK